MEIIQKKVGKPIGERILRICILSLFLSFITPNQTFSQESDSAAVAASDSSANDEGPSLSNLSKSLAAGKEEMKRLQEKARQEEIMSYVYMGAGFSIVIGIAWFTTVLARKRKKKENEIKATRLQQIKHKPHHHRR